MFQSLWQSVEREISGVAATQAVIDISRFHRIQASPGFRQAAEWVYEQLSRTGLQAQVLAFPADRATTFWSASSFQEWEASEGTLHLIEPADHAVKLADYREQPLHLVSRSLSFDGEAELIVLDKGTDLAEYEGLDLRGKIVLARGSVSRVHYLAVLRHGAVGLIYDGMMESEPVRPAWALPDTIQYTSFWWPGAEPQGFGFAITPRSGERLRRLAREQTLRVRAHVDARLYDGTLEVVEAVIPGTIDEEVVLVAHLCHPQPSANDNASGAAALMEVARSLTVLIERGELTAPRRSIRFLWLPEMTGTYAYLSSCEERIPQMVAGLNLDMVGQDQEQCGGSFLLEDTPHALSSFATVLLTRLREQLLPQITSFTGGGGYPLFRYANIPFGGGSDHYIFSDPTVGVPMPMINQWPDRYYHTSDDTPDRVDPQMMGWVSCLTAAYAYWLAQAGEAEANWLAREMSTRFRQEIMGLAQAAFTRVGEAKETGREELLAAIEYRSARHQEALQSLTRIAAVGTERWYQEDAEFGQAEYARVVDLLPSHSLAEPVRVEGDDRVVRRCFRGPVQSGDVISRLDTTDREKWWALQQRIQKASSIVPALSLYWADGERTIAEIATLVRQETGLETTELLVAYMELLSELALVALD